MVVCMYLSGTMAQVATHDCNCAVPGSILPSLHVGVIFHNILFGLQYLGVLCVSDAACIMCIYMILFL